MAICETCKRKYTPTRQAPDCPACSEPAPEAALPKSVPAPLPTKPAPAKSAGARTVRVTGKAPGRPAAAHPVEESDAPAERDPPAGLLDQSSKIGLIATAGLAVVVLLVVFAVLRTKAAEKLKDDAYQKEVHDLQTQLAAIDLDDEGQATRLLKLAKDQENRWKNHELAPKIQALVARAASNLETGKERRETVAAFTEIEEQLKEPAGLTPEVLNDLRRRLAELETKITLAGDEYVQRHAAARPKADGAYVLRLLEGAQEKAATPRPALVQSQKAEDEIKKLLEQAYLEKNQALQDSYAELYRKAIDQSDQLALTLFTDKDTQDLPWTDCLSGEQAGLWNASQAKGFSHRIENGVLQIVGPDADAGRIALISIGDREQWRNFVLEIEFAVERGNIELFLRLGRSANANTVAYPLITEGDDQNVKPGRPYKATMRLLGSQFSVRFSTEDLDTPPPKDDKVTWAKSRKGALGFLVPPGARFKVTGLKVRELR